MHIFPVETCRLRMQPVTPEDEALYVQLYTDEETMRYVGAPLSLAQARRAFAKTLSALQRRPIERLSFRVLDKATDRCVGICTLQDWDRLRRRIQAGIMFVREVRARGFAKEAFVGLIGQTFRELPVDELWVQFPAAHPAVRRGVISVGFTERAVATDSMPRIWAVHRETWSAPAL